MTSALILGGGATKLRYLRRTVEITAIFKGSEVFGQLDIKQLHGQVSLFARYFKTIEADQRSGVELTFF